jgi:hypothetical protein
MKKIIHKFRKGQIVSNKELKQLAHHYNQLIPLLAEHGELYQLVLKDAENEFDLVRRMYRVRFNKDVENSVLILVK